MVEPVWISKRAVLAVHSEQLAEHGGLDGVRDETLLDSALAKPRNVFAYADSPSLSVLAASYAFGIARNHPFVDGNKRTALGVAMMFFDRNGWEIEAPMVEVYQVFLRLAEGAMREEELASWFEQHVRTLGQ